MNTLKDMVSGDKKVKFLKFHLGQLWYVTECGFEFPIATEDLKGATFLAEDKAAYFMRWIRPQMKAIESAKVLQASGFSY